MRFTDTERVLLRQAQYACRGKAGYVPVTVLLMLDRGGAVQSYQSVPQPVLLLGGSKSPAYLKKALATLSHTLPHTRRVALKGLDHAGPWNTDLGGHPAAVADEMRKFLQVNP